MSPSSSRRSSTKSSPAPEDMPTPPSSNDEDPRPPKRRKLTDPKERTTEYLDLSEVDVDAGEQTQLQRLLNVLHKKRKIVVIAGAGISVSAGIPDFRSTTGLFKSLKDEHKLKSSGKDLFDASVYQDDTSTSQFHDMVRGLSQHTKSAKPTAFHHLLATLAQEGRLMRLYTQNVDGIDTSMDPLRTTIPLPKKGPWPKTVQVHGGLDNMVCTKCHALSPFDAEMFVGPTPPACPTCVENDAIRQIADKRSHGIGRLRPRMVLYNEHNPDDEAIGSCTTADMRSRPDAVIVVGTTLKVPGIRKIASEMCKIVRDRKDGLTVWINNDPEPRGKELEDVWDLVVKGPCDEVARHANMRKWDDPIDFKVVTEDDVNKVKENQKAEVIIGTPRKPAVFRNAGQLTPGQSPRVLPKTLVKEEEKTPSKRGAKRKSELQMDLKGKPATNAAIKKPRALAKKASSGKGTSKKPVKKPRPINSMLKATKPTSNLTGKVLAKVTEPAPGKVISEYNDPPQLVPNENISDTIQVAKRQTPSTPRTNGRLKTFKKTLVMQPVTDADQRNNYSPKRPQMECLTPIKSRTPSEQLLEETQFHCATSPTSDSRPSSASSQRDLIVQPESIPHNMGSLLH
jgi:NAD-dependent histone deacetylase SIR2